MRWSKVAVGTAVGAVAGFFVGRAVKKEWITPEKALKIAKEKFRAKGPISGSWIYMKPQTLSKENIDYKVYYGGITRQIEEKPVQYEFYVDAKTGTIVDVSRI
ncbi:PepSY domain-containing protein [Salirhabdus sp. Marseille-P4669]|uniref:PepSY domain-containing protein n=1 Tax=Salirhabdus sp. Marseille-P4669 TaxID=2042310 RepID=UPI000C7D90CA|nr:PepSY domain-containing protein [Salirhabdus sp. Marseille-P4669]